MAFAGARSTDQDNVTLAGQEAAICEIPHQRLVDGGAGELEAVEVLGQRQLGDGHLVSDRPRLLFRDFGFQQIANNARRFVLTLDPSRHHLVVGATHAVKLQFAHQGEDVRTFHGLVLLKPS